MRARRFATIAELKRALGGLGKPKAGAARVGGQGGNHSGPHTALVKACLSWLAWHGIPAYPMNTGATVIPPTVSSKGRFVRFAFKGCSDIIGIIPGSGKLLAVECKTGRGELSDDQRAWRDVVVLAGGVFVEARSVDGLAAVLGAR